MRSDEYSQHFTPHRHLLFLLNGVIDDLLFYSFGGIVMSDLIGLTAGKNKQKLLNSEEEKFGDLLRCYIGILYHDKRKQVV